MNEIKIIIEISGKISLLLGKCLRKTLIDNISNIPRHQNYTDQHSTLTSLRYKVTQLNYWTNPATRIALWWSTLVNAPAPDRSRGPFLYSVDEVEGWFGKYEQHMIETEEVKGDSGQFKGTVPVKSHIIEHLSGDARWLADTC